MNRVEAEKELLAAYPYWGLDPNHPRDCVTRQAAIHLVDECRKNGFFPDNPTGYWTPVLDALRAASWHVVDVRGRFELLILKKGVLPGSRLLCADDVQTCLY